MARAWRLASDEFRALRELRPRVGIHRALAERIRWNLDLAGVDSATMSALVERVEATRGEAEATRTEIGAIRDGIEAMRADVASWLADSRREIDAEREMLAAYAGVTKSIAARVELDAPSADHIATPVMLERMLALQYWLTVEPPSDVRVSVIIPTRSRPALVSEAIASVQAQSHTRWELIVVDDGSVDDTRATLAAIDDDRVRYLRTDGLGSAGARCAALELVRGEVIAYLDDDNLMLPGWLAAVAWAFSHFDDVDVLYGARVIEDETPIGSDARLPRVAFSYFDRDRLLEGNYIDASVIAHRAKLPQAHWDAELSGIADWDLMLRLTEDKPALALPVVAAIYRTGAPERQTHTTSAKAAEQRLRARLGANGR